MMAPAPAAKTPTDDNFIAVCLPKTRKTKKKEKNGFEDERAMDLEGEKKKRE